MSESQRFQWPDLSSYGLRAILQEVPSGKVVAVIRGDIAKHGQALADLGYRHLEKQQAYVGPVLNVASVLKAFPDATVINEGDIVNGRPFTAASITAGRRPAADAQPAASQTAASQPATTQPAAPASSSATAPAEDIQEGASIIGTNRRGLKVMRARDGRRFLRQDNGGKKGEIVAIHGSPNAPADGLFLLATTPSDMAMCAEAFVFNEMRGPVRFEDLRRFVAVTADISPDDISDEDPRLVEAYQAIDTGISVRIASENGKTSSEVFSRARQLSENDLLTVGHEALFTKAVDFTPAVGVIVDRVLGSDISGSKVQVTGLKSGSILSALANGANVRVVAPDDASRTVANQMGRAARRHFDVAGEDAETDYDIRNLSRSLLPSRVTHEGPEGSKPITVGRADLLEALESLDNRSVQGRSVFILRRGPQGAQEDSEDMEAFREWVGANYAVEGCVDVDGAIASPNRDDSSLRIMVVGRRRPMPLPEAPEPAMRLQTAETWSALWSWTSLVVASRAKIDSHYEELQEGDHFSGDNVSANDANEFQVPYMAMSRIGQATTMVPRNMEASIRVAQKRFVERNGNVDDYVSMHLAMTREQMAASFSPEQVDAIGMGIDRILSGLAPLVSDQTGIGKGRTLIGLSRFAALRGMRVVYMTESADSFSDIVREVYATGSADVFAPFLLNAKSEAIDEQTGDVVCPENSSTLLKGLAVLRHWPDGQRVTAHTLTRAARERLVSMASDDNEGGANIEVRDFLTQRAPGAECFLLGNEALPAFIGPDDISKTESWEPSSNLVLATYTQFNKAVTPPSRRRVASFRPHDRGMWLREVADANTMVVMDEAHNAASGDSHVGRNFEAVMDKVGMVVYASATWAKHARNFSIFRRMFPRKFPTKNLVDVIRRGGETMQETLSSMLAREGVLIRREHDLSKCEFTTELDEGNKERNHEYVDRLAPILSEMAVLAGEVGLSIARINENIRAHGRMELIQAGQEAEAADVERRVRGRLMNTTAFGSPLQRLGRIFNAALLIDSAVEMAVKDLGEGRKPVILLESTLQSMMAELAKEGGERERPSFSHLLHRTLSSIVLSTNSMGRKLDFSIANPRVEAMEALMDGVLKALPAEIRDADQFTPGIDNTAEAREADVAARTMIAEATLSGATMRDGSVPTSFVNYLLDRFDMVRQDMVAENPENENNINASFDTLKERMERFDETPDKFARDLRRMATTLPSNPMRALNRIRNMIDSLPELPVSAIDAIKEGITRAGYSVEEITGRTLEVVDGTIQKRTRIPKGIVKDAFNRGDVDAVIINVAGATAIDLHAGARFADQRQRRLIVLQAPEDIQRFIQALGRVRRYDQVIGPIISTLSTGLPVEVRQLSTQNTRLRRMSANTNSSRENESIVDGVPDLINAVGDRVVTNYLAARPEMVKRLGLPEMEALEEDDDDLRNLAESTKDSKRSANTVLARVACLLGIDEQKIVMQEIEAEYRALIEELNAKGANPLKTRFLDGTVTSVKKTVFSGVDVENPVSEFDRPVYAEEIVIEHSVEPVRANDVIDLQEKGLAIMGANTCEVQAERIRRDRDRLLAHAIPMTANSLEDAVAQGNERSVRALDDFNKLASALDRLAPGKSVKVMIDGFEEEGIVTRVNFPIASIFGAAASHYELHVAIPGFVKPAIVNLGSLIREGLKVGDGLLGEEGDAFLDRFDHAMEGASRERRIMLTGNEWAAMEMAVSNRLGNMTSYRDSNGVICRGILVNKNHKNLDFMTVNLETADLAISVLDAAPKVSLYGSSDLKPASLAIRKEANTNLYRMAFPSPDSKQFGSVYEHPVIQEAISRKARLEGRGDSYKNYGRNKPILDVTREEAVRLTDAALETGTSIFTFSKMRQQVNTIRQQLYANADEPANAPQAPETPEHEDNRPENGFTAA